MLFYVIEPDKHVKYYLQGIGDPTSRKLISLPFDVIQFSPDGAFLSCIDRSTGDVAVFEVASSKYATVFSPRQVQFAYPTSTNTRISQTPMWLYDSSTMLMTIQYGDGDVTTADLWTISKYGEAAKLAEGVGLLANSADGKYWLYRTKSGYYLSSLP
jgi:hypothetical protein